MQNFLPTTNTTPGFLAANYFTPGPSLGFNEVRNDKSVEFSIQPVLKNFVIGASNPFIPDYEPGDTFSMAIGNFDQSPTQGTVQLQAGVHTAGGLDTIAYNVSASALATALNAALTADGKPLASVLDLGNGSYIITGVANGALTTNYFAVVSSALLYPISNAFFTPDTWGSPTTPYRVMFTMRQAPMCYAEPTVPFTSATVSVEPTQNQAAGQSAVRTIRFNVPQVSAGSFVIGATADGTDETCGSATPLMSAREFGLLLANHSKINYSTPNQDDNISVTVSGQAWIVTAIGNLFADSSFELVATDNPDNPLVAPLGLSGTINYNTFGLLAYSLTAQTTEEGTFTLTRQIQMTRGSETRTLYSGPVTIYKDLIDAATAVPTPTINYYTAVQVDALLLLKMDADAANATLPDALNNLLPDQTGNAGKVLVSDGTAANWKYSAPLVQNVQTGDYTLILSDDGKYVRMNKATAVNLTVPTNASVAIPIGSQILVENMGAGQVTVVEAGGVDVHSSQTLLLRAQYSHATLIKVGTDEWNLVGDLEAA